MIRQSFFDIGIFDKIALSSFFEHLQKIGVTSCQTLNCYYIKIVLLILKSLILMFNIFIEHFFMNFSYSTLTSVAILF